MGNSYKCTYTCPQLTTSAQRKNYLIDNVDRAKITVNEWSPLIEAPKAIEWEDFMAFYGKVSDRKWKYDWCTADSRLELQMVVDPDDKRVIKELDSAQKALKFWAQMRGWPKKTYSDIKEKIKVLHDTQLQNYTDLLKVKRQKVFSQIRKDILAQMEVWVKKGEINQNTTTINHKEFKEITRESNYSGPINIEPLSPVPARVQVNDPQSVLGWDWTHAWHAVNLSELSYIVSSDDPKLGGARVIMFTDHMSFVMEGSCVSYGGDDHGGISNAERNRRERAKPSTRHHIYTFKLKLIKY